jgi:hypothetical protein
MLFTLMLRFSKTSSAASMNTFHRRRSRYQDLKLVEIKKLKATMEIMQTQ